MKRMKLSELTGNEILAQSLMTWDYQIILPEGAVLKKEYISKIEEMGILEVYVKEDQENEIVILKNDIEEMKAKNETAERFQALVADEIIPSIRKHGAYMTPQKIEEVLLNPDTIIKLATELKAEQKKRVALESKVEQDKPLVAFANSVSVAKTSILVGELAKLLKQNGVDMGQNRLFAWMRENGYLISRKGTDYNMPTQRSMEMKLFEIKETTISHGDGHTSISKTPKVTGKGQIYFINLFLGTQQNTDKGAS